MSLVKGNGHRYRSNKVLDWKNVSGITFFGIFGMYGFVTLYFLIHNLIPTANFFEETLSACLPQPYSIPPCPAVRRPYGKRILRSTSDIFNKPTQLIRHSLGQLRCSFLDNDIKRMISRIRCEYIHAIRKSFAILGYISRKGIALLFEIFASREFRGRNRFADFRGTKKESRILRHI